jgi:hypothetical protein
MTPLESLIAAAAQGFARGFVEAATRTPSPSGEREAKRRVRRVPEAATSSAPAATPVAEQVPLDLGDPYAAVKSGLREGGAVDTSDLLGGGVLRDLTPAQLKTAIEAEAQRVAGTVWPRVDGRDE